MKGSTILIMSGRGRGTNRGQEGGKMKSELHLLEKQLKLVSVIVSGISIVVGHSLSSVVGSFCL